MKETNNFMAVKKSTEEVNEVSDVERPIYDTSDIRNKPLLSSIATKSPADLYFFCWLGYLKLKKIDIGLPFQDFGKNYVVFQAYTNLTQIRIRNKRYDLLETVKKGYKVKRHEIEYTAITLSPAGRKIWLQAEEDGLWDLIRRIPKSYCVEFEPFSEYFRSHYFFSHSKYLNSLKRLEKRRDISQKVEELEDIVRDDQGLFRGIQKLEKFDSHSSRTAYKKVERKRIRTKVPELRINDTLRIIYSITKRSGKYDHKKWVTTREFIQNNHVIRRYKESLKEHTDKDKQRRMLKRLHTVLYKQIVRLCHHNLLRIHYYQQGEKKLYKIQLTYKGKFYVEKGDVKDYKVGLPWKYILIILSLTYIPIIIVLFLF